MVLVFVALEGSLEIDAPRVRFIGMRMIPLKDENF